MSASRGLARTIARMLVEHVRREADAAGVPAPPLRLERRTRQDIR